MLFRIIRHMPARGAKAGFTLIELLVVVLILGVLAAVAAAQYQKAVEKSRFAALYPVARAFQQARNVYYTANGTYPTDFADLDLGYKLNNCSATDSGVSVCKMDGDIQLEMQYGNWALRYRGLDETVSIYGNDTDMSCQAAVEDLRAVALCKSVSGLSAPTSSSGGFYFFRIK